MTKKIWFWVALVTAYVMGLFLFGKPLFFFLPEDRFQTGVRVLIAITLGFVMWKFIPNAWSRVVTRPTANRMLVVGIVCFMVLWPVYRMNELGDLKITLLLGYFLSSMLVGLAEEFVSRGVVFGLCERVNVWWAAGVSSVSFGVMHFLNLRGGADLGGVVVLVIGATGFGMLMAGVMVYSGTIWIPIAVHGLYNFPMVQFSGDGDGGGIVTVRFVLMFTFTMLVQISVGLGLIWLSKHEPVRIKRLLVRFKLIDEVERV